MDPEKKARLGTRYACFSCEIRFYDMNRPEPLCPKCGADQRETPVPEAKPKRKRKAARKKKAKKVAINPALVADDDVPTRKEETIDSMDLSSEADIQIDKDD